MSNPDAEGFDADIARLLVDAGLAASRAEARRLLQQNAVTIDGERSAGERARIAYGSVIRVGRRRFVRIVKA